jgi:hypothetical protein
MGAGERRLLLVTHLSEGCKLRLDEHLGLFAPVEARGAICRFTVMDPAFPLTFDPNPINLRSNVD